MPTFWPLLYIVRGEEEVEEEEEAEEEEAGSVGCGQVEKFTYS